MASKRGSIQTPRVYVFTITILKVTRIPSPMRLSFSASSSLRIPSRRTLKITVLHGSKQKELGEFDIVQDECLIDQRISCRLFCAKEDDLGKLHIYIDQAYSSGLAGHVALDLKEFLEDMDSEVYIKYPLSATSPREGYVPKLKMTLECTCLGNPENLLIPDLDTIIHHKRTIPSDLLDSLMEGDSNPQALSLFKNQDNENSSEPCPEMHLLEELETVLFKLDTKLKNFVANCKSEDEKDIPVDSSTVLKRPVAVEPGEDCSDCIVCSKGLLDKFQGISSGLSSSCDMDLRCSKDVSTCPVPEEEKPKVETRQRPNVLKHVFGGMLLVGLSIFAVKNLKKNERPLWPNRFGRRRIIGNDHGGGDGED